MSAYYNPQAHGLVLLGSLEQENMSYEFNILAAWRHVESGDLVWAQDSGCSCPSPFEDFTSLEKFSRGRDGLRKAINEFPADAARKRAFRKVTGVNL